MEQERGEKDTTPLPRSKILPILASFFSFFFFPQLPLARSVIFKRVAGCPLASRAGGVGRLLGLRKHL